MTEMILIKRRSGSADSWLVHPINRRDQMSPETAAIAVGWAYSPSSLSACSRRSLSATCSLRISSR